MHAPVLSQSSARTVNPPSTQKPRTIVVAKKKRLVRRRRWAKGDLDSDDEVEREVATDSESEDDDLSSVDSPTDNSETEPVFDDILNDRAHLPTPRNSKSPETAVQADGSPLKNEVASFFSPSGNWSDMVAEENANGSAGLPVIEFSDFKGGVTGPSRKHKKAAKLTRSSAARAQIRPSHLANDDKMSNSEHVESLPPDQQRSHSPSRNAGHAARQAYQHRLETDPSYVPTIGNFWGHDDRLIDADLRSLSGWWRRGRGRGRGRGGAIRGHGGFQGATLDAGSEDLPISLDGKLPPIDRPWKHDGFEDMKRKEEQRRAVIKQQKASHHAGSSSDRGTINPLCREPPSPATARTVSPVPATRARFLMKPELMWTKQHEAFLYFDSSLKPRPGQGPGVRIKLPGLQSAIVRSSLSRTRINASAFDPPEGSEGGDRFFVVCLPKGTGGKEGEEGKGDPSSIEDVFAVRPLHRSRSDISSEPTNPHVETPKLLVSQPSSPAQPQPAVISQLIQLALKPQPSDQERQAKTEQAVLRMPSVEVDNEVPEDSSTSERLARPSLHTTFTPPPQLSMSQPSPAFSSPYGYSPALPLGIAMNQDGILYEVATGRPVYLQPAPLYNPRPLMHTHMAPPGIPFVPVHMPHHSSSTSPDFLPHPPSHTPPGNGFIDPLTGTPIFSFPRQTSRIEIRAPTEETGKPAKSASRISSGLRTTAPSFQPSRSSENLENGYYRTSNSDTGTSLYENMNGQTSGEDVGMMAYPTYQQPFYPMEPYGYSQYMDMSQAEQYDMYNMDQQGAQGAVYY